LFARDVLAAEELGAAEFESVPLAGALTHKEAKRFREDGHFCGGFDFALKIRCRRSGDFARIACAFLPWLRRRAASLRNEVECDG
jgi:hypothetical protein